MARPKSRICKYCGNNLHTSCMPGVDWSMAEWPWYVYGQGRNPLMFCTRRCMMWYMYKRARRQLRQRMKKGTTEYQIDKQYLRMVDTFRAPPKPLSPDPMPENEV